jgi:interleukin-1 receptor-associated kinase 1
VYSFGVLLLEVAMGEMPVEVQVIGGLFSNTLVSAARESYGRGSVLEMERVLLVILLCVQQDCRDRPEIRIAVNMLSDLSQPVPRVRY